MRRKVLVEILFICAGILFLSGTVGIAFAVSNSGDENQNPVVSGVLEVSDSIENIGTVNTNVITSSLYNQNGILIWQVTPNLGVNNYYLTDLKFYAMLNKNENKLSILIDSSEESKALRGMIPSLRNEENRALCSNPDPAHYCYKYSSHKTLIYDVLAEVFDELKDKSVIGSSASLSSNTTYRSSFTDKMYIFGYYLTATEYNCNWHCFHNWPWGSGKDLCNYGKREGKPGCYACEYSDGTVEITFDYSISNPKHYYVYGYNCNDNGEETKYTYNGNLWLHQVNCGSKQDVKYGTTDLPAQITLYGHKTWSKNCLMTWMVIDADSVTATGHIHGDGPTTIDRNEEPDVLTSIDLQKLTLNWPLSSTTCGKITNWETKCQGAYSPGQKVGAEMEFESLMGGGYNFKGVIIIRSPTGDEYTNSEVEWVPSAPNPHGKFAAGDALYVTIPEGASVGNYDMKLELWNDDTDELCDATEWKDDLFTVGGGGTPSNLLENPGFESGELDPWYSTKYYDPYDKCDWINIGVDREARYEGEYGAYIDIQCSLDAWGRIIQEPVVITPGESLAVEAKLMYKGDLKDGYAELWLVFLDADKKSLDHVYKKYYLSDFDAEGKWLSAVLPATTAPSNAKYVRIMVGLADVKSCRLNIDDVILKYGSATENHPPTATKIEPTSDSITIEPGDTQEFKVKAEDVDEEEHNNLKTIEWFVDDVLMETDPADGKSAEVSFSYTFENAGMLSVKATAYDEQMEKASITWDVNVGEASETYRLEFEAYDFDIKSEVIMILKYGESVNLLEFLPSDDDSNANENWIDYSIDITEYVMSGNNILGFDLQENSDGGKVKNVRIFRNDELIYAFNPITEIKLYKLEYLLYEFDTNEIPVKIDWAGPITIEMYAPKEIEKGGGYTIRIIVKLPRSGEYPVIHQHGKIGICYSEKVDIASEPVLQIRQPDWDWDTYETFKLKKGCDLFGAAIEGAIGKLLGKYNPGAGVGLSVIKEAHKCEVGYAHGGPPASEEWKDINEYDIYDCVYDVGYCGLVGLDRINAFYPLKFNEVGEYKICAFVDLIYKYELLSQNKRIGKELVWTVKVIE